MFTVKRVVENKEKKVGGSKVLRERKVTVRKALNVDMFVERNLVKGNVRN